MNQTYSTYEIVASGQALTSGFASGNVNPYISVIDSINAALLIEYSMGSAESGNSLALSIAESYGLSGATFYLKQEPKLSGSIRLLKPLDLQYPYESVAGGKISISVRDVLGPLLTGRIKVLVKEIGVSANFGTVKILAALSRG